MTKPDLNAMLVEYIESEADRQSVLLEVQAVNRRALDALRAENERLRAALEKIERATAPYGAQDDLNRIAREALR